jgi:hypothetical protein
LPNDKFAGAPGAVIKCSCSCSRILRRGKKNQSCHICVKYHREHFSKKKKKWLALSPWLSQYMPGDDATTRANQAISAISDVESPVFWSRLIKASTPHLLTGVLACGEKSFVGNVVRPNHFRRRRHSGRLRASQPPSREFYFFAA